MPDNLISLIDRHPGEKTAVVDQDGEWTYAELLSVSRKVAGYIIEQLGSGGRVIIKMDNSRDFVSAILGTLYSGNTPVPVSNDLTEVELDYIRKKTKSYLVLTQIDYDKIDSFNEADYFKEDVPALILFTSGTTGFPKGAVVSHKNISHTTRVISEYLNYQDNSSTIIVMPLCYSYALVNQLFAQLAVGGSVYILKDLRNPLAFFEWINRYSISTISGVSTTFHTLAVFQKIQKLEAKSIRVICSAGGPFAYELYNEIKRMFPNSLIFNNYGLTEAVPRVSFIKDTDPYFSKGSCGKPIKGVEVRIWSQEKNDFLPENQEGILVVRGPNVIKNYLDDSIATEKAFAKDNFFISGDLALIKDGYIYIKGRADDVFNTGGEKISPYEIEMRIKKHPAVKDTLVAGLPDSQKGKKVAAFLVLREKISKSALLEYCNEVLAKHKVPVIFFELNKLPMTSNGKISRKALLDKKYQKKEIR